MSHFHSCFGGRFGKIHEEPLAPFSCTLHLLSGVCSALLCHGDTKGCLISGKVGMLNDGLCVLVFGYIIWGQL